MLIIPLLMTGSIAFAQLSGTYYIPGTSPDYPTIQAAVEDLNSAGVSDNVTFLVDADYIEVLTSSILLTATGSSSATIVFQKNGTGENPMLSRTDGGTINTSVLGGQGDAVIIIEGSDYLTFDGIDVTSNNQGIEYGYYLRKSDGTDGCKNVTITNCVINMTKGTSGFVAGIYASNNVPSSAPGSAVGVAVTSEGGRNENIAISGNTIRNTHVGMLLRAYNHTVSPYNFYDQNFVVGTEGMGNTIENYGGGSNTPSYGVYAIYHNNITVSYNTINNNASGGSNFTATAYGIFHSSSNSGNGAYNYNNITLSSNTGQLRAIMAGSSGITDLTANNNSISLSQASTYEATGIYFQSVASGSSININNNIFSYGNFASTIVSYLIFISNLATSVTIAGNQTSGSIIRSGANGNFYGIYNISTIASGGSVLLQDNNFSNIALSGSSLFYGIHYMGNVTQPKMISGNIISNVTSGSGVIYGINTDYIGTESQIKNNKVTGLSSSGSAPIPYNMGQNSTGSFSFFGNECGNISFTGNVIGYGANFNASTVSTCNVYSNKIYNITGSGSNSRVYGIQINSGTVYVYNNFISELKAPNSTNVEAIAGIFISINATTVGFYYNTIYLNASSASATTFGTSGISANTSPAVDLRNNIIVNTSATGPTGGLTVAYRRTSSSLGGYASISNNNDFYAGTPSANHLIFYDGTNTKQTLTDYQAWVLPRDAASFTEMPPLENILTSPYDLHINPKVETFLKNGGIPILNPVIINTDLDGIQRNINFPCVGAIEFDGTGIDLYNPTLLMQPLSNTTSTGSRVLTASFVDPSGVPVSEPGMPRLYWKINSGNYAEVHPVYLGNNMYQYTFGGGTAGDIISYYLVARDEATTVHIGSYPSGASGFSYDPPVASIPPSVLYNYTIYTAISSFPHNQGFESSKSITWSTGIYSGTANDWMIGTPAKSQLSGAHTGTKAYVTKTTGYTSHNQNAYVLSPHFDFTGLDHPILSFWHNFKTEWIYDVGIVEYSINNGLSWLRLDSIQGTGGNYNTLKSTNWYNNGIDGSTTGAPLKPPNFSGTSTVYTGQTSGWIKSVSDIVALSGQIVQFRFRYGSDPNNSTGDSEGWAIDDISVYNLYALNPAGFIATANGSTTIDLAFTPNPDNNAVLIVWNESGEFSVPTGTPPEVGNPFAGGTLLYNGTSSPQTHSGLNPGTTYYFKAFSYDGSTYSAGLTANGTTYCESISSFPWSESFESAVIPFQSNCWLKENGDWVTTNNATSTRDANANSGNQFLREQWSAEDEYIWSPGFELESGSSYNFSFWWAGDGYEGWTGDVFYNTDQLSTGAAQMGSSFVTSDITTTLDYTQAIYTFSPPETGTYYFAIRVNCPTNVPWYLSFDDFSLDVVTSVGCPPPIAINITTVYDGEVHTGSASVPTGAYVNWYDAPEEGNITIAPSGIHTGNYSAWAETVNPSEGCTSESRTQVIVTIAPVTLSLKVMLQGPYHSGIMNTDLYAAGQIPAEQPYGQAPWNYYGTDTATPTSNSVDWVLVELRLGTVTETMVFRQALLLNNDGTLNITVDDMVCPDIHGGSSYYIVVWHRNHMPVMSKTAKNMPVALFDMTALNNLYGTNPAISLGGGVYGMITGDNTADGLLQYSGPGNDRGTIIAKIVAVSGSSSLNGTITNGYWKEDVNLDINVLYMGSDNDRGIIIQNLTALTGEPHLTNIYTSVVPGATTGLKANAMNDGYFDLFLSESNTAVNIDILNKELIKNGLIDNLQLTLAWQAGDNEIADMLNSYYSDFMLAPQGNTEEADGIMHQVFASATPVYLPAIFDKGEKISVLSFAKPEDIDVTKRLWIAEDDFTNNRNGIYYVSVWGTDQTGMILTPSTGINNPETGNNIQVYPNPILNHVVNVHVRSVIDQEMRISVYSLQGNMVTEKHFAVSENKITTMKLDVSGFKAGVYMINVSGENMTYRDLLIIK